MSDNDDPFGRRERTIIRPNPGGRRPAQSPGGAPPAATPTSPVAYPPPAAPPQPAYQPPPQGGQGEANWDGWATTPTPPPVNPYMQQAGASAPMTPAPISPHISVDLVAITANPLMRASSSLLLLLARFALARGHGPIDGSGRPIDRPIRSRCARVGRSP